MRVVVWSREGGGIGEDAVVGECGELPLRIAGAGLIACGCELDEATHLAGNRGKGSDSLG